MAALFGTTRLSRALLASLTAIFALLAVHLTVGLPVSESLGSELEKWLYNAVLIGSAAACLLRAALVAHERAPWLLLGIGMTLWAAGDFVYTLLYWDAETIPFPSSADALWLAFYPPACAGLLLLFRARLQRFPRILWLDSMIGGLTVAALGAAVVFDRVVETTGGSKLAIATNLAYPLGDLLLLSLVVGVLALAGWQAERTMLLTAAGFAIFGVADSIYLYTTAAGTYTDGTLIDLGWPAAMLLLAFAAWQRGRPLRGVGLEGWRLILVPMVFTSVALALLVYDHFVQVDTVALVLCTAAAAAAIARMGFAFHENARLLATSQLEAITDSLTELGNRRKLMDDLACRLREATESDPLVLVLLDLDGFKAYNDSFGHLSGDALLRRLAADLRQAVSPWGEAYRMGGDEFCVLASVRPGQYDFLVVTAAAALHTKGNGFEVTCARGVALLPEEADEPSEALRLADTRMYTHKDSRRPSLETKDALLRAVQERNLELGAHVIGVGELTEAVASLMGLTGSELDQVRRVAELHDIGKLAIPDTILNKPTALNDEEWEFVRRHTIVGERILAAAPALAEIAELVRSTHEHFDGHGYPDGLVRDDIPLPARIVAVCDAFDAMISDRPYRAAMSEEDALDELRRCAGGQFDPGVVDAFCSIYHEWVAAQGEARSA